MPLLQVEVGMRLLLVEAGMPLLHGRGGDASPTGRGRDASPTGCQWSIKMGESSTEKRSLFAMLLSLIIPGLGQFYLRKPLKGFLLLFGVLFAGMIFYVNSIPVNSWQDLTRFDGLESWWEARSGKTPDEPEADAESFENSPAEQGDSDTREEKERQYHIITITEESRFAVLYKLLLPKAKEGDKLMYRPSWAFKVTALIQGIVFWIYAIYDGWSGRRGFNKRALKKRLRAAEKKDEAELDKKYESANTG